MGRQSNDLEATRSEHSGQIRLRAARGGGCEALRLGSGRCLPPRVQATAVVQSWSVARSTPSAGILFSMWRSLPEMGVAIDVEPGL